MKEKIAALLAEAEEKIKAIKSEGELQQFKGGLLGKQGRITELLKELPKIDPSQRPEFGKAVNQLKEKIA